MSKPTVELVNTQWFDANAIRLPDYKVGRINYGAGRSYIRILPDGSLENPFRLYTSLTTALNSCAPMERPLLEWYCKLGLAEADRYVKMKQHYGTLMHILIGDFLMTNTFDFEAIDEKVQEYLSEHSYFEKEVNDWPSDLRYDIAAFIKFANDVNMKALGVEYVLLSERGYGTLIDIVCEMTIQEKGFWGDVYLSGPRKGEPKESTKPVDVRALINMKSGRHQFYRVNGIQVACEKILWEENFPDLKVDRVFNWSPKDWDTTPSYNLKDWTEEIGESEISSILNLADIRFAQKAVNKKYVTIGGQYYSTRGLDECVKVLSAEEWANKKYSSLMFEGN